MWRSGEQTQDSSRFPSGKFPNHARNSILAIPDNPESSLQDHRKSPKSLLAKTFGSHGLREFSEVLQQMACLPVECYNSSCKSKSFLDKFRLDVGTIGIVRYYATEGYRDSGDSSCKNLCVWILVCTERMSSLPDNAIQWNMCWGPWTHPNLDHFVDHGLSFSFYRKIHRQVWSEVWSEFFSESRVQARGVCVRERILILRCRHTHTKSASHPHQLMEYKLATYSGKDGDSV